MYHFGHQVPAVGNIPDEYLPPNNILFLQNLPNDITGAVLTTFFGQYVAQSFFFTICYYYLIIN